MSTNFLALWFLQRLPLSSPLFYDFIEGVGLLELGRGSFFVFPRALAKLERIFFFIKIMRILFLILWIGTLRRGLYLPYQLNQRLPTRQYLAQICVWVVLLFMDKGKNFLIFEDLLILFFHLRLLRVVLADLISVERIHWDSLTDILCTTW